MKSAFNLLDAICGWCEKPTECVEVDLENGRKMDLCWACLKKKAKLANRNAGPATTEPKRDAAQAG